LLPTKEDLMRILWLPLTLLLAVPSWAADRTVLIPLRHIPATAIDRHVAPPGITAWTVDEQRNGLSVTGSEEAIRSFTDIIDRLDVLAPSVRLAVKVVRLEAPDLAWLKAELLPGSLPGSQAVDLAATVTGEQIAALRAREVLSAAEITVAHNMPLHLAWPGNLNQQPEPADVLPRVNGDGTVTLFLPRPGLLSARLPAAGETIVMRRIAPGHGIMIYSHTLGTALIVSVREVLPADKKKGP
jgi:hypothetical protein